MVHSERESHDGVTGNEISTSRIPEIVPINNEPRALKPRDDPHNVERWNARRILHEVEIGFWGSEQENEEELKDLHETHSSPLLGRVP